MGTRREAASRRRLIALGLTGLPFVVLAVALVAILATHDDEARLRPTYLASFVALEVLGIVVSLYAGLRRGETRPVRRAWLLMAFSFGAMMVFGAAFGAAAEAGTASVAATTVMLVARFAKDASLLAALLSFPTRLRGRRERAKLGFDLATAGGGGFMLLWYFVVGPAVASPSTALTTLLFPVGDLMLFFGIGAVLLRGAVPAVRAPLSMVVLGVAMFFGGDLYSSHQAVYQPGYVDSSATTGLVLAGMALTIAAAGVHCRRPAGSAALEANLVAAPSISRLPYVALAAGYGVLILAAARTGLYPWLGLVAGAVVMTGGIAARQIVALRDNYHLAVTDQLTGLANRAHVHARLEQAIERARRTGDEIAVLLIDLDGFKQINDRHGHEAGDRMLTAFAAALRDSVRDTDVAGRLGGDEFAVVLARVSTADAVGVADRLLAAAAARPVRIAGRDVRVRASIGIAVAPAADVEPGDLMHRADVAMYRAKRDGRDGWRCYTDDLAAEPVLERDLRDAIDTGQLRLAYQPIVALDTGRVTAVEALVRWQHPALGLLAPADFVPLAEETDLIHALDAWVLEQACTQVGAWQRGRRIGLSVNLSARGPGRATLADEVAATLARTGFAPTDLVLEVTATGPVDGAEAVRQLTALRSTGIRIALDDFGTGHASLRCLTRLPLDILKLDRGFVADLGQGPGAAAVEAVARLARRTGLVTVAKGIEDAARAGELASLGYDLGQGFHFAGPLDPARVEAWLDAARVNGSPESADPAPAGAR
jgi:diguanylate cyclase (GGDEF)-like protein